MVGSSPIHSLKEPELEYSKQVKDRKKGTRFKGSMKQIVVVSESDKCLWGKKWCISNYEAKKKASHHENMKILQLYS